MAEHRSHRGGLRGRAGLRGQHQGCGHQTRNDGNHQILRGEGVFLYFACELCNYLLICIFLPIFVSNYLFLFFSE